MFRTRAPTAHMVRFAAALKDNPARLHGRTFYAKNGTRAVRRTAEQAEHRGKLLRIVSYSCYSWCVSPDSGLEGYDCYKLDGLNKR